jgi:hypothetical protein
MKRAVSTQSASRMTRLKLLTAATAAAPAMSLSPIAPRVPPLLMGGLLDNTRAAVRMASSAPAIDALTVPELKAELRQRGMPVSGVKAALVARLAASEPEPTATAKPTAAEAAEAAGATASKAARATPAAKVKKPTAKMRAAETAPTPQKRRERTRKDAPALTGGREVEEGGCVLDLDGADLVRGVVARRPSARNKSPYVGDVLLEDGREVNLPSPHPGPNPSPDPRSTWCSRMGARSPYARLALALTLTLTLALALALTLTRARARTRARTLALSVSLSLSLTVTRSSCTCHRWTWAASAARGPRY